MNIRTLLCLVAGMHYVSCFPEMAGNCNGLYGVHVPNLEGGGDGGYVLTLSDAVVASNGDRVAKVIIQHLRFMTNVSEEILNRTLGTGEYAGFLIKSYDPYTGLPLGSFQLPLPPRTMIYGGCSPPESAVCHSITEEDIEAELEFSGEEPLEIPFAWPATRCYSSDASCSRSCPPHRDGVPDGATAIRPTPARDAHPTRTAHPPA
jgi:hypothetical protein